jgi:hypothetical protein
MTAIRACFVVVIAATSSQAQPLPGTKPLDWKGDDDLAAKMVAGIDKYLMRELEAAPKNREKIW